MGFYSFDVASHIFGAIVSFLLSFYFHRLFAISREKNYKRLRTGFLLLSIALTVLAVSDTLTYIVEKQCPPHAETGAFCQTRGIYSLESFSYFLYFGISLIAYIHFIMAYGTDRFLFDPLVRRHNGGKMRPENELESRLSCDDYESKGVHIKYPKAALFLFIVYALSIMAALNSGSESAGVRAWQHYDEYFSLIVSVICTYASLKSTINYAETKCGNTLFVAAFFGFLSLSNILRLFSFVSPQMYVFSHILMAAGFMALLAVVLRVAKISVKLPFMGAIAEKMGGVVK